MKTNKNCVVDIVAIAGIVVLSAICIKYEPALRFAALLLAGSSIVGIAGMAGRKE